MDTDDLERIAGVLGVPLATLLSYPLSACAEGADAPAPVARRPHVLRVVVGDHGIEPGDLNLGRVDPTAESGDITQSASPDPAAATRRGRGPNAEKSS